MFVWAVYKLEVTCGDEEWSIYRRFSHFTSLQQELAKVYGEPYMAVSIMTCKCNILDPSHPYSYSYFDSSLLSLGCAVIEFDHNASVVIVIIVVVVVVVMYFLLFYYRSRTKQS